jgi:hypothetical protein
MGRTTLDPAVSALDQLEVVVLPILLGEGLPLSPSRNGLVRLGLESERTFSDGSVELS